MNPLMFNNAIEAQLAPFFKKNEPAPKLIPRRTRGPRTAPSKPNYYIYNSHTQEVIELQRQCSDNDARQAFRYLSRMTPPKSLTFWAVIGVLKNTQAIRFRKIYNSGEAFEVTPNHPLKVALMKAGYNFEKGMRGGDKRKPALPKITLKVLGGDS